MAGDKLCTLISLYFYYDEVHHSKQAHIDR